jgi:hypothetical protein
MLYKSSGYFQIGGTLEKATAMANRFSTRTTQLYNRRTDKFGRALS